MSETVKIGLNGQETQLKRADLHGAEATGIGVTPDDLYQELIQRVRKYHPSDDISVIEKAYRVASEAHSGQMRKSG